MKTLSPGKIRGLQQLANEKGILAMVAADHRDSLKKALNPENPAAVSYQDMVDFKLDICRAAAPFATAFLLDPVYGAAQAIAGGALPARAGLLVSMEETGYTGDKSRRLSGLLRGWSARKARRLGASACKLLLYYRPDVRDVASKQLDLVKRLAEECLAEDIALLVEVVSYPADSESEKDFAAKKPQLVIETARQITALPVDVLKTEFPADPAHEKNEERLDRLCRELNDASLLPWVLLSAGAGYEVFRRQVELTSGAGASGFLAGRALWQEAPRMRSREERLEFLKNTTAARLREITGIANSCGTPWFVKLGVRNGVFPPLPENWYRTY